MRNSLIMLSGSHICKTVPLYLILQQLLRQSAHSENKKSGPIPFSAPCRNDGNGCWAGYTGNYLTSGVEDGPDRGEPCLRNGCSAAPNRLMAGVRNRRDRRLNPPASTAELSEKQTAVFFPDRQSTEKEPQPRGADEGPVNRMTTRVAGWQGGVLS
jgi:hypothetical protein